MKGSGEVRRFLFVCTGNTCRSPLAQVFLHNKRPDLEVKSAGVHAVTGSEVSEGVKTVLGEKGIQFNHQSNQVDEGLMEWADIVLTLTTSHKATLIKLYPQYINKIYTLKQFAYDNEETEALHEKLQHHYAQLELKRMQFIAEHKHKIEELNQRNDSESKEELNQLTEQLQELANDDIQSISQIEQILPSYDISDPFGGSTDVYRKSSEEIEQAIVKLIEKIESSK